MSNAVRGIVLRLDEYDPTTLSVDPAESRDLLKKLYQQLFPKSVRHDLGEYYTPDWLAEHVLNELEYEGIPDERILDPACGSGTFLVMAINRIKSWFDKHRHECGYGETELVQKILKNVIGFDLNPLAVMAARTNYLMALRELVKHVGSIEIPIYLCDSVLTPTEFGSRDTQPSFLTDTDRVVSGTQKPMELRTVVGKLYVPQEIATSRETIGRYTEVLEFCVRNGYSATEFISRCREDGLPVAEGELHSDLFERMRNLDRSNENGIWARIIKNAFAPLFTARVDYVAGNPPWINWESLPGEYRESTKPLWQKYGLLTGRGQLERMRAGKKDVAMLMLYAATDSYLRDGGRLGFVITQTVFKSKSAGDGFRRFRLGEEGPQLRVLSVHDLVELQPFEGATNRTATITLQKGSPTEYPVAYTLWRKAAPGKIAVDLSLGEVEVRTKKASLSAIPVIANEAASPWLTASPRTLAALQKVLDPSDYQAHAGSYTGGLNGVYWLRVLDRRADDGILVENLYDVGKVKVERLPPSVIEPDLVYPLLRGRDVSRWRAGPSEFILVPQSRKKQREGIPEEDLKVDLPHTYGYLKKFERLLAARPDRKYYPKGSAFYTMRNVADYTFAVHKVVWREQANELTASALIAGQRPMIPDHKLMLVPCSTQDEAFYLSACLNSAGSRLVVASCSVAIGMSTHVLEHVAIPEYDDSDPVHQALATLSERAHRLAGRGKKGEAELRHVEDEIDGQAAVLWGMSKAELEEVRRALADYC